MLSIVYARNVCELIRITVGQIIKPVPHDTPIESFVKRMNEKLSAWEGRLPENLRYHEDERNQEAKLFAAMLCLNFQYVPRNHSSFELLAADAVPASVFAKFCSVDNSCLKPARVKKHIRWRQLLQPRLPGLWRTYSLKNYFVVLTYTCRLNSFFLFSCSNLVTRKVN